MKYLISTIALFLLITSCKDDSVNKKDDPDKKKSVVDTSFSRKNMLIHWADNVILPGYNSLAELSSEMNEAIDQFTIDPTIKNLQLARESWEKTYIVWQKVSITQLGLASKKNLAKRVNNFPSDIIAITENIDNNNYNLSLGKMTRSEGLPALDYLLNAPNNFITDQDIVKLYKINGSYRKYIKDVADEMTKVVVEVRDDWTKEYRDKFVSKDGTNDYHSTPKVIKYFVQNFINEELIEKKILIPSHYSPKKPEKVEAYYKKDISKKLFLTALNSSLDFFNGKSFDGKTTSHSLKQYLIFLDREDISDAINEKFSKAKELSNSLEDDFSTQISHPDKVKPFGDMYNVFFQLKRILDTDFLSAVGFETSDVDTDND